MNMPTLVLTEKQYDSFTPGDLIARQGDVLLFKPSSSAVVHGDLIEEGDKSRVVLAYGEVTGHAHAFYYEEDQKPLDFQLFDVNASDYANTMLDGRLLRLNVRSLLKHEEHFPMSLPPRDFIVVIQHEGDELGELRKVAD